MYCANCHTYLDDEFLFCTNCGIQLRADNDEQETVIRPDRRLRTPVQAEVLEHRLNHRQTAESGRDFFKSELSKRGIKFIEQKDGQRSVLVATNIHDRASVTIRVKTKRNKGNWHSDTKEAKPIASIPSPESENEFWAFVNLNDFRSAPTHWIVPDSWLRNDIYTAHQKYLDKRAGKRAKNDDSTHHSIDEKRLGQWLERWNLLDR